MSDVSDPQQASMNGSVEKSMYARADKRIVFGSKRPTEDTLSLTGFPLLIEAPFPSERTLHWLPTIQGYSSKTNDATLDLDDPPQVENETTAVVAEGPGPETDQGKPKTAAPAERAGETAIVVSQEVLLKVNEHVAHTLDRELGGFLLGNRYRCPSTFRDYVIIDQYSQAKFTESTEINLAFTHEAWAQLSDELSGKFLGKLLIGWYHSHPRMDVFLSNHDMEIQTERFPEPWMVALVLEPEKHRGGFFCARDGLVKPNTPVDFFELLERNTRDSVLAWENYSSVDPSTSAAPVMGATNTASTGNGSALGIPTARSEPRKKAHAGVRRRGRSLILLVVGVLLLVAIAVGVRNRNQLKNWFQNRNAGTPVTPQPSVEPAAPAIGPPVPANHEAPASPAVEIQTPSTESGASLPIPAGERGPTSGELTAATPGQTEPSPEPINGAGPRVQQPKLPNGLKDVRSSKSN